MLSRRDLCGGFPLVLAGGWLAATAPPVWAEGSSLEANDALAMASTGALLVVDVRSAGEWGRTGVPRGAAEVSLFPRPGTTNENFIADVLAAVGGDKSTPIATICATGVRSSLARDMLRKNGFTAVYDISEGMFGSKSGPGWLRRGLPVDACRSC